MTRTVARQWVVALALCTACGGSNSGGSADSGLPVNPGPDAGIGPGADAGTGSDAGTADAGSDGGTTAFRVVNGCQQGDYVDQTAGGLHHVEFGNALGIQYVPRCLIVSPGQTVSFIGNMGPHPLSHGAVGGTDPGDSPNPIFDITAGSGVTVTFPDRGYFPYHCVVHAGLGMTGTVLVK
jgi:plastocyanin